MKPNANGMPRAQMSKSSQGERPNWILIAGCALLSTLSMRLGYMLKQVVDNKQLDCSSDSQGCRKSMENKKLGDYNLRSDLYCFTQHDDGCFNYISGNKGVENKQQRNNHMLTEQDMVLSPVTISAPEYSKENGVIWASSPDRLELAQKPFHHFHSSDSPCVSESGSDNFTKREVVQKLRQQLKRRDDMILEMQDQIVELQNEKTTQLSHASHLQSLLDAVNRDLFYSEREKQRLRKAIADHCVGKVGHYEKPSSVTIWPSEGRNGHANGNGCIEVESALESLEKIRDVERIEVLRRKEVSELKDVVEGKEYLIKRYKEQNAELSVKIKDLQQRLDFPLPDIL